MPSEATTQTSPPLQLDAAHFPDEGLYLLFADGTRLDLTHERIEAVADAFWKDPSKIPPGLRAATWFQPCQHCPHKGEDVLCLALRPLLPYVEFVDRYVSYDKVTAVYRGTSPNRFWVSHTVMQEAVRYLALLSMISYCEMGDRYRDYFAGIVPIMESRAFIARLRSNIILAHLGNPEALDRVLPEFKRDLLESTRCLLRRLGAVCQNDAFLNAFVSAHLLADLVKAEPGPEAYGRSRH